VVLAGLHGYLDGLRHALKKGKLAAAGPTVGQPSGSAAVDDVMKASAAHSRPAYIAGMTKLDGPRRRLKRNSRYFDLPAAERERVQRLLTDYRSRRPDPPPVKDFYDVEDVCGRIAGIGSMGRYRYAVLLAGKGGVEARNVILEFKEARPSGLDIARAAAEDDHALTKRAQNVIATQQRLQAASSDRLGYATDGVLSFQVRELGPADGRVPTKDLKSTDELIAVARLQGDILSQAHLRSAGDAITSFAPLVAEAEGFVERLLAFALAYAELVRSDWSRFVAARPQLDDVAGWTAV
jgi:uncharacterized protein (DUF2252 family)